MKPRPSSLFMIKNLWLRNFNKGVSVYQMCLMASMAAGAIINSQFLVLFSMVNCLFAYFEPNQHRYGVGK